MSETYHLPEMKIVINRCYGGFSLSRAAVQRLLQLGWKPSANELTYLNKEIDGKGYFGYSPLHMPRHDPLLIQVVEELGSEAASGDCAKLAIETITPYYSIRNYDGMETLNGIGD
jgi:hypothetical protein